jgi:hypothetical protein
MSGARRSVATGLAGGTWPSGPGRTTVMVVGVEYGNAVEVAGAGSASWRVVLWVKTGVAWRLIPGAISHRPSRRRATITRSMNEDRDPARKTASRSRTPIQSTASCRPIQCRLILAIDEQGLLMPSSRLAVPFSEPPDHQTSPSWLSCDPCLWSFALPYKDSQDLSVDPTPDSPAVTGQVSPYLCRGSTQTEYHSRSGAAHGRLAGYRLFIKLRTAIPNPAQPQGKGIEASTSRLTAQRRQVLHRRSCRRLHLRFRRRASADDLVRRSGAG